MEILFTSDATVRKADEIVDYLRGPRLWIPRLDYPDFDAWVSKVHGQLRNESKRALVAIVSHKIVGVVIYQRHGDDAGVLEIKNLTVRPDQQGRHLASFMVRNAEREGAADFGSSQAVVDAKTDNLAIRALLGREHYRAHAVTDLYGLGAGKDVVYRKNLAPFVI